MIRLPRTRDPEASRRRASLITGAALLAAATLAPRESLDLGRSLVGIAAAVAVLAGFGRAGTPSLKPWLLTTFGLASYAAAALFVDNERAGLLFNLSGLVALAGAVTAAYSQRSLASINERVEVQHRRHRHRNRWGAAMVAAGVAITVLSLRVATHGQPQDADATSNARASDVLTEAPYLPARVQGRLEDSAITEASGLVASGVTDALWVHNDSGNEPQLFCVREDGSWCGRWRVNGAGLLDWEDIARRGRFLYIGDIGDNNNVRSSVTVYVVAEPDLGNHGAKVAEVAATRSIELRYQGGPRDAEAMLVDPSTGDLYVMSKGSGSRAYVHKADHPLGSNERLTKVGTNRLVGLLADRTAMDVSPDGNRVVIATYGGIYELVRGQGERFVDVWDNPARLVDRNIAAQVEAVAYARDGAIVFTEEAENPRIWRAERI